jgi:signal transduction histidine kinase
MSHSVKCLLVDDNPQNLVSLSALLAAENVEVVTASSGVEALEQLLVHEVAVALLDVQMPEMDGFQLAELMRGTERTRLIPIIFLTAGNDEETRSFKGYEVGAVDILYKPVSPFILQSKLRTFLELHRQRQQLAAELADRTEALRLNEQFVAMVGHDLRSPLTAILMSASSLQRQSDAAQVARLAEVIQQSGQRMARMIEDILDLARLRLGGGFQLQPRHCDLRRLSETLIDEQNAALGRPVLTLTAQGDAAGVWDEGRLSQALSNLLLNAVQHGEPGQPVALAIDGRQAASVCIEVQNRGAIPEALLPDLFNPFKSGALHRPRQGNLGLGLFIVQQVVKAHGGTVVASSMDGSTRFRLELPRYARTAA